MKNEILIPKNTQYLSEAINELPANCLFDKGKVGCGGTTLALKSKSPYVVCVPFVSLIQNKVAQSNGKVFGFYAGAKKYELEEYLEETKVPKIMVTYDSLAKLSSWINPRYYKLLIDEYHILFLHYSFREDAVKTVLNTYKEFQSYCFMTATPLEKEFLLEELKELPIIEAIWDGTINPNMKLVHSESVLGTTCMIAKSFLDGTSEGNAYFFVNSVSFIKDVIGAMKLTKKDVRLIYSKNNKTRLSIPNSDTLSKPKKINFLTSTCFEGADIYDKDGKTFIVSDNSKPNTMLDISTSIQQIAGRIRDTQYYGNITHIFSQTRYSTKTYNEMKAMTYQLTEETKAVIAELNNNSENARKFINRGNFNDQYVRKNLENNTLDFDPNKVKIDLFNYKITAGIYSIRVNIGSEYKKYAFNICQEVKDNSTIEKEKEEKETFKDVVLKFKEASEKYDADDMVDLYEEYTDKYPFIGKAIRTLGFDKMEELNYVVTNIKRLLIKNSDKDSTMKIFNMLKLNTGTDTFIPSKTIKNRLTKIYKTLGIKKTAKASDIKKYYMAEEKVIRKNGKIIRGYIVIRTNIQIKA